MLSLLAFWDYKYICINLFYPNGTETFHFYHFSLLSRWGNFLSSLIFILLPLLCFLILLKFPICYFIMIFEVENIYNSCFESPIAWIPASQSSWGCFLLAASSLDQVMFLVFFLFLFFSWLVLWKEYYEHHGVETLLLKNFGQTVTWLDSISKFYFPMVCTGWTTQFLQLSSFCISLETVESPHGSARNLGRVYIQMLGLSLLRLPPFLEVSHSAVTLAVTNAIHLLTRVSNCHFLF